MSLKTWKEEFYPIDAEVFADNGVSDRKAIEHSLTKWKGLREGNLDKHKLILEGRSVWEEETEDFLSISTDSCSLCVRYYNLEEGCPNCPLQQTLGNVCDRPGANKPYTHWQKTYDPEPMIDALERTLQDENN